MTILFSTFSVDLKTLDKKGENYRTLNISGDKKSFLREIKSILHKFLRALFWLNIKKY